MYRPALRASSQRIAATTLRQSTQGPAGRRFASTTGPNARRGWKNSALRWGLAAGAIYYYNTSSAFAEEPPAAKTVEAPAHFSDDDLPTVEAVVAQKRQEAEARLQKAAPKPDTPADKSSGPQPGSDATAQPPAEGSPEALEQEAGQQGAFNPETGEINWDCPCLGGMAHGPCGEEFRAAFSCFVYSEQEPKGMDCIEKFQGMQDCFRKYPEIYGEEMKDDEDETAGDAVDGAEASPLEKSGPGGAAPPKTSAADEEKTSPSTDATGANNAAPAAATAAAAPSSQPNPSRISDATEANDGVKPKERTPEGAIDREASAVKANKKKTSSS